MLQQAWELIVTYYVEGFLVPAIQHPIETTAALLVVSCYAIVRA